MPQQLMFGSMGPVKMLTMQLSTFSELFRNQKILVVLVVLHDLKDVTNVGKKVILLAIVLKLKLQNLKTLHLVLVSKDRGSVKDVSNVVRQDIWQGIAQNKLVILRIHLRL